MYLKLSCENTNYKVLINFDQVTSIGHLSEESNLIEVRLVNENRIFVTESIDEIELMLKGIASRQADPRERNMIGRMSDSV